MKSAMTELKDKLQVVVDELADAKPQTEQYGYREAMKNVIKDIDAQMLEKERQQIINARLSVTGLNHASPTDDKNLEDAEQYYDNPQVKYQWYSHVADKWYDCSKENYDGVAEESSRRIVANHVPQVSGKTAEEVKEDARQYAESMMYSKSWDRKDAILVGIFYGFFIEYLMSYYTSHPRPATQVEGVELMAEALKGLIYGIKMNIQFDTPDEQHKYNQALRNAKAALSSYTSRPAADKPYQNRVNDWMMECFSMEICRDTIERNHRLLEESLELVQSLGCTQSEAHQLVDYVFGREIGEPHQEVGGVMVTLAALCLANDLNMDIAAEDELKRVWTKIDKIREKQAAKPKHSPLPQAADTGFTEFLRTYFEPVKEGWICDTENDLDIELWSEDNTKVYTDREVKQLYNESITNKNMGHVYHPIPLTPEILEACGFIRNDQLSAASENYEFPIRMGLFFLSKTVTAVNEITYYNLSFPGEHGSCYLPAFNQCQYLHQLQNLYFALTGTELNYAPTKKH